MELHGGVDGFAPLVVGQAEYRAFVYGGVRRQRVLDVDGIDVKAAGDDDVAQAVLQEQIAARIDQAGVAGVQPAVDQGFSGLFRQAPIARHRQVALHHDFADFTARQQCAVRAHDGHVR
ncbi:hypothetical protein D3C72_2037910 [compost metagenome]